MVHDCDIQALCRRTSRWSLPLSLREHRHDTRLCQPQDRKARGRATSPQHLQTSRYVKTLLLQVLFLYQQRNNAQRCNSHSYDITSTLQNNLTKPDRFRNSPWPFTDRYVWNFHMMSRPFTDTAPRGAQAWLIPLIHGHVDQASKYRLLRL